MKLANKVKNTLQRFIEGEVNTFETDDGYHKIQIAEPELGHIIINIQEHRTEVKAH